MAVMAAAAGTRLDVIGRDVDDVASAAFDHDCGHGSPEQERPLRVRAEQPVEVARGAFPVATRARQHELAGVVDQDVDRAVFVGGRIDDGAHVNGVSDVADVSGRADRSGDVDDLRVAVGDSDRASLRDQCFGECSSEPSGRAGDDRNAS